MKLEIQEEAKDPGKVWMDCGECLIRLQLPDITGVCRAQSRGLWGMGHGAWGMGHRHGARAWGMGHK